MAGSNGVLKFQEVNRDDEIVGLKIRGSSVNNQALTEILSSTITSEQLFNQALVFTANTPSLISLPSLANITAYVRNYMTVKTGSGFYVTVLNNDPSAIKTIVLPTGITFKDNGSANINIPQNTRYVFYFQYTAVSDSLNTMVVYSEGFTGSSNMLGGKQGSAHFLLDNDATRFLDAGADLGNWTTLVGHPPVLQRDAAAVNAAPVSILIPLGGLIAKLNTDISQTKGTVVTKATLYYQIQSTDPTTLNPTIEAVNFTPVPPTALITAVTAPSTSDLPAIKPAGNAGYAETITLTTPYQITENSALYFNLTAPTNGFPASAHVFTFYGITLYFNYQLSV